MRPTVLLPILVCLATAGCSTVSDTLSTDVWLCAYQLGDRYRDDASKPDVVKYDTVTSGPVRRTTLTYLLPVPGTTAPAKRTLTCEAAPWGFGVTAEDGFKLAAPAPSTYPGNIDEPAAQGRTADKVRDAVRQTGLHVHIPGIPGF